MSTAPDLSAAEAAKVAEFEAAPTPPEVLREQVAVALWQSDVDDMAAPDSVARLWPKVVEQFPEDAAAYRRLADAALAVFRGQQDPAVQRVLALADDLNGAADRFRARWHKTGDPYDEGGGDALDTAATRIRAAIGGDGR